MDSGVATSSGGTRDHRQEQQNKSSTAKAAASKTDRGTVERMDALAQKRPDLAAEVKAAGDMRKGGNACKGELRSTPSTATPPTLAEYRLGEMLKEAKAAGNMRKGAREPGWKGKHGESASDATRSSGSTALPSPTLAELGVSATEVAAEILRRRPKPHPRRHTNERNTPGVSRDGE
jgi:hypothetical protein